MRDEIFRRAVVNARGVDAHAVDLSLLRQELSRLARDAGEMQICRIAWRVRSEVSLLVRPELSPTRPYQSDRIVGDTPVRLLPRSDVVNRQAIIGVFGGGLGNIYHDGGRHETRNRNLVPRPFALAEMERSVQVRAAVLARGVSRRRIPVSARRPPP